MKGSDHILSSCSSTRLDVPVDLGKISFIVHVDVFISIHVDTVLFSGRRPFTEPGRRPFTEPGRCSLEVLVKVPLLVREAFHWDVSLDFMEMFLLGFWRNF